MVYHINTRILGKDDLVEVDIKDILKLVRQLRGIEERCLSELGAEKEHGVHGGVKGSLLAKQLLSIINDDINDDGAKEEGFGG